MGISIPDTRVDSPVFLKPAGAALEPARLFGRQAPLYAELGCGNGHFLTALAAARPECDFLGVDIRARRIEKSCSKADRGGLGNIRFVLDDAYGFLENSLPPGVLDTAYVNFPDPWPKYRHRKFRLNTERFLRLLTRALAPGGTLWWVCDHYPQIIDVVGLCRRLAGEGLLVNRHEPEGFSASEPDYPATLYEKKWRASGRPIFYVCFTRTGSAPALPMP